MNSVKILLAVRSAITAIAELLEVLVDMGIRNTAGLELND